MLGQKTPLESVAQDETQLEYVGRSWGLINVQGPVTKLNYRVSLAYPYISAKTVDVRSGRASAPGLVQMTRNGGRVFRLYTPPQATEATETLDPEGDILDEGEALPVESPEVATVEESQAVEIILPDPSDISTLSVDEIKSLPVDGFDWAAALEAEKLGKDRTTAITYIEGLLS